MSNKIGRPKGGKNPPDPLRRILPGPAIKRDQSERRGKKYISSLALDTISHTVLKLHAYRRQVHMSTLISDILNLWMAAQTDYDQALFKEVLPRNARAALVPERWAGYIESLGFAPHLSPDHSRLPLPSPPLPPSTCRERSPTAPRRHCRRSARSWTWPHRIATPWHQRVSQRIGIPSPHCLSARDCLSMTQTIRIRARPTWVRRIWRSA